jgi:hypothetical protein
VPLTVLEFIDFVIIPEVANFLIKGDLGIAEGGNYIRESSSTFGSNVEPGLMDDPILDMLNERRAERVRKKKRKAVQLEPVSLYQPTSDTRLPNEDTADPQKKSKFLNHDDESTN